MSGLGLVLSLPNVGETVEAARMAEQAGFESVWTTDFTDRSATVAMGRDRGGDRPHHHQRHRLRSRTPPVHRARFAAARRAGS